MFALIDAAGWPIWFLIVASVIALAIIGERWWSLRESIVMPRNLLAQTIDDFRESRTTPQMLSRLARSSPLGQLFAAGLRNAKSPPAIIKEAIEESGRTVAIELERFLTSLGTIAIIAPLLFMLVMGLFEFGRMMMVQEILTNGAREGARKAALPGATSSDVTGVVNTYLSATGISGHTTSCAPDPATAAAGANVTVTISVPYTSVSWLPASTVRWLANTSLSARVVMRKEEY